MRVMYVHTRVYLLSVSYGTNIHRRYYVNVSVCDVSVYVRCGCMRVMYVRACVYLSFASCMEQTHTEGNM